MSYGNNSVLNAVYDKYSQFVQRPPMQATSALNDLDAFMRNVSGDDRKLIESSQEVANSKQALLLDFFDYMIGATPFGQEFCTGVGSRSAQNLFDTVKKIHKESAGLAESKQQETERLLKEQAEKIKSQDERLKKLCEQLGVDNVGHI